MDKQIVSRFYLITIDNDPIYVGFTNRPISVRFREHKHDKELPDSAKVQEIDKLVYDFSWDIVTVNINAKEVSDRESELIKQYGTQDSLYQKAIGGGQVWNEIKHFITINREDPFWKSMPEDIILATIEKLKTKKVRLTNVINNTRTTKHLEGVIYQTKTSKRLKSVIYHTKTSNRLENVISHTNYTRRLEDMIHHTKSTQRLESVIGNTKISNRLENVIGHTKSTQRLEGVVYQTKVSKRLEDVIKNTRDK